MSARGMLGVMAVGTVAVMLLGARWSEPAQPVAEPVRLRETPWLTEEAAAQVIGPDGRLGPLFAGVSFGEPVPPQARARIAAFARRNHVAIDLEVAAGELSAIRFEVSYSGCCGYEAADVLALRLDRPHTGGCTWPDTWIDDWAITTDDDTFLRARVRVNRVNVRWERALTAAELVERTDRLVGQDARAVRESGGDRWTDLVGGHLLEVPFGFEPYGSYGGNVLPMNHEGRGLQLVTARGRIVQVSFALATLSDTTEELRAALRKRWGRPDVKRGDTWTWRKRDRTITADADAYAPTLTIRAAGAR